MGNTFAVAAVMAAATALSTYYGDVPAGLLTGIIGVLLTGATYCYYLDAKSEADDSVG